MDRLSVKDKRILALLCIDARMPLKSIAKKVGLSPEGVSYRIKKLEEDGIIEKYSIYPDEYKFGLQVYHIYFRFHTLPSEVEAEFKKTLIGTGYCSSIRKTRGNWDFLVMFFAKNPFHLDEMLSEIFERKEFLIKEYKAYFVANQFCFSQLVGDDFKQFNDPYRTIDILSKRIGDHDLSDNEIILLKYLNKNSRAQYSEISKSLDIPQETIRYSINKLREKKIIITTFAVLNKFKLGYSVNAIDIVLNTNAPSVCKNLISYLINNKYVHYAAKVTGTAEINVIFTNNNYKQFEEELERIRNGFFRIIEEIKIHPIFSEEYISMFPEGY